MNFKKAACSFLQVRFLYVAFYCMDLVSWTHSLVHRRPKICSSINPGIGAMYILSSGDVSSGIASLSIFWYTIRNVVDFHCF